MSFLSKRNVILLLILTIYLISLFLIYLQFPELKREEKEHFRYPRNLEDAKSLGRILLRYKERHFLVVLAGCSAAGATVCYFISYMFGKRLIVYYFPARLALWQIEVQKQGDHLLNYIIFLRITPILPNWFINLASPIVDVPLVPFFFGTLLGVAPPSFLFIQAGTTLQMMTNANVVWSWNSILLLSFFAILSLAPVLYKRQMLIRSKEEEKNKLIKSE
uniref:Transmembrane protein 41B n=1 Tax=Meloidogyne floridensis TaxID=298350 RepID=A0A915P5S4_9BILA